MSEALRRRALDYLAGHHVMTLATAGPEGPWAAAVFYAGDDFRLCFLSSPKTRHGRNLAADPRVAATVQEDYRDWRQIRGLQIEGAVEVLEGAERDAARACYAAKFPFLRDLAGLPAAIATALERVRWYRLRPAAVHFIDNTVAFGQRERIAGPY